MKTPKRNAQGCKQEPQHPNYEKELSRLNRVAGQVEGVKKMIAERRHCPDILTQLRAIHAAVRAIEASILETHLDSCVTDVFESGNEKERTKKIAELVELYRWSNK